MWIGEAYLKEAIMSSNWYVIQVERRKEEEIATICRKQIASDILIDSFVPKYKRLRKYQGKWHQEEAILFSGYVFLISDYINDVFQELKKIPDLTKLLGNFGDYISSLYEEEVNFLQTFSKDYVVDISSGYIEGDKIVIIDGPLMGYEGRIKKTDRHKRLAYLEVKMFDQITLVKVGLEVVSKNKDKI